MKDPQDTKLVFYTYHESNETPRVQNCLNFTLNRTDLKYPCCVLMRINNWNDAGFYSHFVLFYLKSEKSIRDLGTVKIIETMPSNGYTVLPNDFLLLDKNKYFARGTQYFYDELNSSLDIKNQILSALNDIYYHNYTKKHISDINNGSLISAYENSLFRYYHLDPSSEYSKNSISILDKVDTCIKTIVNEQDPSQKFQIRLLYGSVVTALESYLGDAFKYHVINNKDYFNSFLINYKYTREKEKKYFLKDLYPHEDSIGDFIKNEIKIIMDGIVFHNIKKTVNNYKDVLNIDLPSIIMDFQEPVQNRHAIFHRNGLNIAGEELEISAMNVSDLILEARKVIGETEHILDARSSI